MQGIYKIINKVNGKYYVGSTGDFECGWAARRRELRRGFHHNPPLQNAWNKYGEENFVFETMEEVEGNNAVLLAHEQVYLDEGFELEILYNIARKAGGGNLGEDVNQRISKSLAGVPKPQSEAHKAKLSKAMMGHEVAEETRAKISKALIGKPKSEEYRANMIGHEVTEETRAKLCKASAKHYPAFFNVKTGEYISEGYNLKKICDERQLSLGVMYCLKTGRTEQSRGGWGLA